MKKITRELFNSLKPAEQEMIISLGIPIDDSPKEDKPSRRLSDSILEKYACVVNTECKLCKTVKIKVFEMEGTGGLLTSRESSIDCVDGMTIKSRNETTLTCSSCHDVLKLMAIEDLIALTIKAAKGDCRTCRKS